MGMNTTGSDTTSTTLFDLADAAAVAPADGMHGEHQAPAPEQLTLLPTDVPLQFRLDERTRRSGLQHVAELRAQIARQAAARAHRSNRLLRPTGRQIAA